MNPEDRRWICCQLGSREHYAIPRVLHREGRLAALLTDFWCHRSGLFRACPGGRLKKLAERCHKDLNTARVEDIGADRLLFDVWARHQRWSSWETTMRRNQWFQAKTLHQLRTRRFADLLKEPPGIFFAYSYAARDLLRFFHELGWMCILGQIDPAEREEHIVAAEIEQHPEIKTEWRRAPPAYWQNWREEIAVADLVLVNSAWSRQALTETGVPARKVRVVPLAYENAVPAEPDRTYPERFDHKRPLRVLFLGQLNIRKGLSLVFDTITKLQDAPIEFWMVGPTDIRLPENLASSPSLKWIGPVSRSEAGRYYREADLFLLPTLSDGFALTQLEAQAHRLPVIASRFCGEVVEDGENGWILDPLTSDTLTEILRTCLAAPSRLAKMSGRSGISDHFSLDRLGKNLRELARVRPPDQHNRGRSDSPFSPERTNARSV